MAVRDGIEELRSSTRRLVPCALELIPGLQEFKLRAAHWPGEEKKRSRPMPPGRPRKEESL